MGDVLLAACDFLCTAVPGVVACAVACSVGRRGGVRPRPSWYALMAVFVVYLFGMLHATEAGTLHDALRFGVDLKSQRANLVPFVGAWVDVHEHALNVVLFVPAGLLLPLVSRSRVGVGRVLLVGAVVSASIEASQLLNSRVTDIDDLIMNLLGTLVGYLLYLALPRSVRERARASAVPWAAAACMAGAFMGRFLLYDELGLAKVIFGF